MKMTLWSVGKAHEPYVQPGIEEYTRRLSRYFPADWQIIPVPRNATALSQNEMKAKEAESILALLKEDDFLVALDEHGKQQTSEELSAFIGKRAGMATRRMVFLIGGAYGIDAGLLKRADHRWSLSQLTFPHQLVRLILAEQLYRACTILRNEKYHHR